MSFEYKMVIVMRQDVEMSQAKFAIQVGHACTMASKEYADENKEQKEIVDKWYALGSEQKKVLFKVKNLSKLEKLMKDANELCMIPYYKVVDVGRTEFDNKPTFTGIAFAPCLDSEIDMVIKKNRLSLWK